MNETATTAILLEMNDAMFVVLAPAVAILALIMVAGVVGNLAICYIFGFKLGPSTQNFLLLSISVFDLLSCTLGIPAEILDMRHYFLFESEELCKIMRFCIAFPTLAAIQVLLVIAADRYRKICQPLYGQIELRHARLATLAIIIIAFTFSVPTLYIYGNRTFPTDVPGVVGRDCSINDKYAGGTYPIVYQVTLAGCFIISTVALSIIYTKIWLETRRHRRYMKAHMMPSDLKPNYTYTSSSESVYTGRGSQASILDQQCALSGGVSYFRNWPSEGNGMENGAGHAQSWNSLELTDSTSFTQTASFVLPQNYSLSSTSLSADSEDKYSNAKSLVYVQVEDFDLEKDNTELELDSTQGTGAHGLLPCHENIRSEEHTYCVSKSEDFSLHEDGKIGQRNERTKISAASVGDIDEVEIYPSREKFSSRSGGLFIPKIACAGLHDDTQIVKESDFGSEVKKETQPQANKTSSFKHFNLRLRPLEERSRRKCFSEDLNKIFLQQSVPTASKASSTEDSFAPPNRDEDASPSTFSEGNVGIEGSQREEEIIDVKRISLASSDIVPSWSKRGSRTLGGVSYQRLDTSQSQHELSFVNSNTSLLSQLSAPSLEKTSENRQGSPRPRPKSSLGRLVVSKQMQRAKSNPLLLQSSMSNLYQSRSVKSNNSDSFGQQLRTRSQSEPPKTLHNARNSQSQPLTQLSKTKSKSTQSLAVQRVKKAFRATRSTLIACSVTTAFILSYLPHLSLAILRSIWISFEHELDGTSLVVYNIFLRSYFVNTGINFFLYGTMNREFREEVSKMWERMKHMCSLKKPSRRA